MELRVEKIAPAKKKPQPSDDGHLGFGKYFSDHMFQMSYDPGQGWHDAAIVPYHSLELDPAAMVLHYGQEVFEGLKAYRGQDQGIYLFRHRENLKRFNLSCARMVIPQIDADFVSDAMKQLLLLERDWIPGSKGSALYIRPNVIAIDPMLGVRAADHFLFYIIVGPVGAYYADGFKPISIYVSDLHVRAVRGGIGEVKTGANYAASLFAQMEARRKGFSQVLWLDAIEQRYVEEVGTMNIFFKIAGEFVTSPLTGSILPGVTRDSVLRILRDWGCKVSERMLPLSEVLEAQARGNLEEVFGTGTAAIISPIKSMHYKGKDYQVASGDIGPTSQKLYDYLLALQNGHLPDPYQWVERIDAR